MSDPVNEHLVLRTARLLLRPLEMSDAEALWPAVSDPEISRYMAWKSHIEIAETVAFLSGEVARRQEGRGATWAVLKNDEFCGIVSLIGLLRGYRSLIYDKAELAYWLGRDFQGQGIAWEAARRVMEYGFEELRLHKIFVGHFAENEASERLIKRLGFRYIGEQIEEFQKDGIWHNQVNYELLAREFANLARQSEVIR